MAAHSSTLAWRIPWMEEPSGLQSMGSQRVGHDTHTHTHTHTHTNGFLSTFLYVDMNHSLFLFISIGLELHAEYSRF